MPHSRECKYLQSNARDTINFTTKPLQIDVPFTWHNTRSAIKKLKININININNTTLVPVLIGTEIFCFPNQT
jgi:hypothetical protein